MLTLPKTKKIFFLTLLLFPSFYFSASNSRFATDFSQSSILPAFFRRCGSSLRSVHNYLNIILLSFSTLNDEVYLVKHLLRRDCSRRLGNCIETEVSYSLYYITTFFNSNKCSINVFLSHFIVNIENNRWENLIATLE